MQPSTAAESPQATLGTAAVAWWPLALLIALAAAAGAAELARRQRRLARTRAMLSLQPRLEQPESGAAAGAVSFAAPPVAIRCRLEDGAIRV